MASQATQGIDLAVATREELVQHIFLQRRLIKALHDKIIQTESHQRRGVEEKGVATSRAPTPPPQAPITTNQTVAASSSSYAFDATTNSAAVAVGSAMQVQSPDMSRLIGELRGIQTLLTSVDAAELPVEVRRRLETTYDEISQLVHASTGGPEMLRTASSVAVDDEIRRYRDSTLANSFNQPQSSSGSFTRAGGDRHAIVESWRARKQGSPLPRAAQSRGMVIPSPPTQSSHSFDVGPLQSAPPPAAPLPRGTAPTPTPGSTVPYYATSNSRPRVETPPRRAPPLMGDFVGVGPQLMPPQALQDKIRARMDAIDAQRWQSAATGGSERPSAQVVTAASQRRLRR